MVRPPFCSVCGRDGTFNGSGFRVVEFADYVPLDLEGGPWPGSDWFCPDHAIAAEELSRQGFTQDQALEELRRR
jgi:hypothetical protein